MGRRSVHAALNKSTANKMLSSHIIHPSLDPPFSHHIDIIPTICKTASKPSTIIPQTKSLARSPTNPSPYIPTRSPPCTSHSPITLSQSLSPADLRTARVKKIANSSLDASIHARISIYTQTHICT